MTRASLKSSKSLQEELNKWAKKLAKSAETRVVEKAKANAPRHLKPYIYGKTSPKYGFTLGVQKVEVFGNKRGAVRNRGSMDAAAQEFGSGIRTSATQPGYHGYITIAPRIRTKKDGSPLAKYSNFAKKRKVRGIVYQRSWLAFPNTQNISGKNVSNDGEKVFARRVSHPGIFPYRRRGYLRVSIDGVFQELKSSIPDEIFEIVSKYVRMSAAQGILDNSTIWKIGKEG